METNSTVSDQRESANFNSSFLVDVTLEDLQHVSKKGAFDLQTQENSDGSKQVQVIGTGQFSRCVLYRLNVCPEGRVYFDILYYRSIVKNRKHIPLIMEDFEKLVKQWLKAKI